MAPYTAMASRKSIQKSCLELLADVALFSTLMKKIGFLLSGVYAGIIFGFVFLQAVFLFVHGLHKEQEYNW